MRPAIVVVGDILLQNGPKIPPADNDHVIHALSAKCAYSAVTGVIAMAVFLTGVFDGDDGPVNLSDALSQHLDVATSERFSGTVLVARGGDILLHAGYGDYVRDTVIACNQDTVYDIGSITKVLTATAIMSLAKSGQLRVDDTLASFSRMLPLTNLRLLSPSS